MVKKKDPEWMAKGKAAAEQKAKEKIAAAQKVAEEVIAEAEKRRGEKAKDTQK